MNRHIASTILDSLDHLLETLEEEDPEGDVSEFEEPAIPSELYDQFAYWYDQRGIKDPYRCALLAIRNTVTSTKLECSVEDVCKVLELKGRKQLARNIRTAYKAHPYHYSITE